MSASHAPTTGKSVGQAVAGLTATPEQRQILERIEMQRERLRSRRLAQTQAADVRARQAREGGPSIMDPDAPLLNRVLWFARQHPVVLVAAAGAAAAVGPSRIIRWAGIVMPLVMKMKR